MHSSKPASCSKVHVGQASMSGSVGLRRPFLTFDPVVFFAEPLPLATMPTSSCTHSVSFVRSQPEEKRTSASTSI